MSETERMISKAGGHRIYAETSGQSQCKPTRVFFEQRRVNMERKIETPILSFNSRRAQEAAKWAESHGTADAFHNAVFWAYFVDGKNLHDIETLAAAAESVGLNGKALDEVLRSRTFKTAVDQDWLRSHHLGITAVPTFRMNGENLVGAQPYEQLAHFWQPNGYPRGIPPNPMIDADRFGVIIHLAARFFSPPGFP